MLNMLNMLRMFWGELEGDLLAREFHIFNISAERSTFQQKDRSFRGNVEYVEFWGSMLNQNVLLSAVECFGES